MLQRCHTCVNRVSSPHCISPGTPPPHLWGSSSRGRSGNETRPSWWTGWCGSRSSPRRWCAPAARSPAPGGTPGSRWRHGSKWLRAQKRIFLQIREGARMSGTFWTQCGSVKLFVSLLYEGTIMQCWPRPASRRRSLSLTQCDGRSLMRHIIYMFLQLIF